jgi:hypothetical protein
VRTAALVAGARALGGARLRRGRARLRLLRPRRARRMMVAVAGRAVAAAARVGRGPRRCRALAAARRVRPRRHVGAVGERDLLADGALDLPEQIDILGVAERDRGAGGAGAAGAADAVHVCLGHLGQIEVDDVADLVDVDAAGRDVGRHQHADLAALEVGEGALAGVLRLVAVDRLGALAGLGQVLGDPVGAVLGAGEDQHPADLLVVEEDVLEQRPLAGLVDEVDALVDALDRRRRRRDRDLGRVREQHVGEALRLGRHGRREEQRLPDSRQERDDALHVVDEAHVEHAVGLVEDEDVELREVDDAFAGEVEQAARGGDQDVEAVAQGLPLRLVADAAEDHGVAEAEVLAVGGEGLADLRGQLAGRGQDQDADRTAALRAIALGVQALQDGEGERGGLASAGLGEAQQVASIQHVRDGLHLDRRRSLVAFGVNGPGEGLDQAQVFEAVLGGGHRLKRRRLPRGRAGGQSLGRMA